MFSLLQGNGVQRRIAQLVERRSPKPQVVSSRLTAPGRRASSRTRLVLELAMQNTSYFAFLRGSCSETEVTEQLYIKKSEFFV